MAKNKQNKGVQNSVQDNAQDNAKSASHEQIADMGQTSKDYKSR